MTRALYHFPTSPFSRRARLAIAHKGLEVELVDARADASAGALMRATWPLKTAPVLVDGERVIGDSTAITRYLDALEPARLIWPSGPDALVICALVDGFLNTVVDVGTRYFALKDSPAWGAVTSEMLGRAAASAAKLAELAKGEHLTSAGWCAADMWLFTMVAWWEGLPARAAGNKNVTQLVSLGIALPRELVLWAKQHEDRADVRAL